MRRGVCGALLFAALGFVGIAGYQDIGGQQDAMQDVVTAQQDYNDGGYNDGGYNDSNDWP